MTTTRVALPAGALDAEPFEVRSPDSATGYFTATARGQAVSIEILGEQDYSGGIVTCVALILAGRFGT